MFSQNRLMAWIFASRKEKKRPFHPEIKQWRELIKSVSFSHCNLWSVAFSSLQNARQNLPLVKSLNLNLSRQIPAVAQRSRPAVEPPVKEPVRNS